MAMAVSILDVRISDKYKSSVSSLVPCFRRLCWDDDDDDDDDDDADDNDKDSMAKGSGSSPFS